LGVFHKIFFFFFFFFFCGGIARIEDFVYSETW